MGVHHSKLIQQKSVDDEYLFAIEEFQQTPIVSFEHAIQSLISIVPTIESYIQIIKDKSRDSIDGLTFDESASIMLYSIQWQPYEQCLYAILNSILFKSNVDQFQPWLSYLKLLFTALLHLPSNHSIVYRGSRLDLSQQYHINEIILWKDLPLCTTSIEYLQSDRCLGTNKLRTIFKIESFNVKHIDKHCYSSSNTFAIILPATKFQVIECNHHPMKDNLYVITLKEIVPSFLLNSIDQIKSNIFQKFWLSVKNSRNSSVLHDNNYRNVSLEHRIIEYEHSWTVDLDKQNLNDQDMNIVVKHALIKNHCKRVRLRDNNITCQGVSILCKGLYNNIILESLDLRNNRISDFGVQCLASAMIHSNVKTLNLESNHITSQGAQYLAQMLKDNRTITELYLSKNDLGDQGIEIIANALYNETENASRQTNKQICGKYESNLQHLYLGQNNITDKGIKHLSNMLKTNRTLTWLWLTGNEISDDGVEILSNILINFNTSIEWLFLNSNKLITDVSVDTLLNMFKRNYTLKTFYINNCSLTDEGKRKLLKMMKTKTDFDLEV